MGVDETGDEHLPSAVNDFILGSWVDSANLFNSSVSYPDGCVCQDASLRVLGDYPITVLQDKTHRCHSWLRLACGITVLEALYRESSSLVRASALLLPSPAPTAISVIDAEKTFLNDPKYPSNCPAICGPIPGSELRTDSWSRLRSLLLGFRTTIGGPPEPFVCRPPFPSVNRN